MGSTISKPALAVVLPVALLAFAATGRADAGAHFRCSYFTTVLFHMHCGALRHAVKASTATCATQYELTVPWQYEQYELVLTSSVRWLPNVAELADGSHMWQECLIGPLFR